MGLPSVCTIQFVHRSGNIWVYEFKNREIISVVTVAVDATKQTPRRSSERVDVDWGECRAEKAEQRKQRRTGISGQW